MVGQCIRGKWRLDALLGVGGSAAVFAATHRNGNRGALKILRRDLAGDAELRARFLREGFVANLVGHPGVVAMIDDDVDDDGAPFLVMELLDGSTLEKRIRARQSMPLRDALRIAESVLDILAAAHAQGIVHGDIKPANVFLTASGEVKLLDFGVARSFSDDGPTNPDCDTLGTPAYMSPEQARGESVDGRADVWSVGALMFAVITGERPRRAATVGEEFVMAQREPMRRLAELAPQLSPEVAGVVDRALAFDQRSRWPDAATMQQALRLALLLEQASGPASAGVQVPIALLDDAPTTVDAFRLLRDRSPRSSRSRVAAAPAAATASAPSWQRPPTPTSVRMLSTLPPGPSTGHRLSFSASIPPPPPSERVTERGRGRSKRVLGGLVALGLLAVGVGFGGVFAGTRFIEAPATTFGAPTASHDGGGVDAGVDASTR